MFKHLERSKGRFKEAENSKEKLKHVEKSRKRSNIQKKVGKFKEKLNIWIEDQKSRNRLKDLKIG